MHCVFFFGTHDYAWIMETDLKPYLEFKETLTRDKKSGNIKKAIDEMEDFLAGKGNFKTSAGTQAAAAASASAGKNDAEKDAEFDALLSNKKTPGSTKTPKRPRKSSGASDETPTVAKKSKSKAAAEKKAAMDISPADSPGPVSNHTSTSKKTSVGSFLDRPTADRPISPTFDITSSSKVLADKDIQPSTLSFGFLGLGIMGSGIVKNLINSGNFRRKLP